MVVLLVSNENLIDYVYAKQRETQRLSKIKLENIHNPRFMFYTIKDEIDNFIDSNGEYYNRFIMIPGLRGVGKTTILYQIYNYLISYKKINNKYILYIDVSDLLSFYDTDINNVFNLFLERIHQTTIVDLDEKIFLFVDEAQLDKNWALYAKLIFDKSFNVFMIFTGSSALDLEANTDATRRLIRHPLYPCNFQEYLLLKHNLNLSSNNFKYLIYRGDKKTVEEAIKCEIKIKDNFTFLNNDLKLEFKKFLFSQGFPFALSNSEEDIYRLINDVVKKIIYKDLNNFKHFKNVTPIMISQIVTYLAIKKPGDTSNVKIAQSLGISSKTVASILDILELSQLIFSVNAYGSAGKMLKKPKEHFFLTPSIKTAINYNLGRYNIRNDNCFAVLAENLVASIFHKLSCEAMSSLALFYDPKKKGVDFLVKHIDRVIPVEVGIGKKTKSQLTIAMNRYDADFGILVSNRTDSIKMIDNVIYIPLHLFALI